MFFGKGRIVFHRTFLLLNLDSKSIRLDVYVEDDTGRVYDLEMQTTFDPFKWGLPAYTFTNRCHEDGEELGDETTKLFLENDNSFSCAERRDKMALGKETKGRFSGAKPSFCFCRTAPF